MATARLDGSLARVLRRLARLEVLIIDDWAMTELTAAQRLDLMEVIDDRHDRAATVLATQIPVANWHRSIGDATYADAILDRVVHRALRIELTGESMRGSARQTRNQLNLHRHRDAWHDQQYQHKVKTMDHDAARPPAP